MPEDKQPPSPHREGSRRYRWPWAILIAVVIAVLLAVLWMSREVARTKKFREQGRLFFPVTLSQVFSERASSPIQCGPI
jgi:hypothetical protein